jgi:hypothetical protein
MDNSSADRKESRQMTGTTSDLIKAESDAQREIGLRLSSLLTLAEQTQSLLERALDSVALYPRPGAATVSAAKVCLILTARLANDFRVCSIASRLGYGLQAMGLAATMVEVVGALSYVGGDEARAIEWAKHTDKRKSYPPRVKDGIDAALTSLGVTEPAVRDQWQRVYTSLCMAKHANPLLSMQEGLRMLPDGAYFARGPDASQSGAWTSCFALCHAVGFGSAAVCVFSKYCADEGVQAQLRNEALEVWHQLRDLEDLLVHVLEAPTTKPV